MSTIDRLSGSLSSVAIKAPVRVATTGPVTLAGLQTIDGVALGAGDRVLARNQANAVENGIWIVRATAWQRATDFNGSRDAVTGTEIGVVAGVTWAGQRFQIAAPDPVVIGVSPLSFVVMGQGPVGAVGPTGPLGPTGPQGAPGTTTVTGGVLGPVSSTIGNVARWNDALGGALNDGGVAVSNLVTLSGSQTVSGNKTFSGAVQFEGSTVVYASDSGASAAPHLTLRRQSASPAANDVMASVEFVGNDNGGNLTAYAQLQGMIVSPINGSEAGGLDVFTLVGGSPVRQGRFGSGLLLGTATGSFQGTGTVNATAYYVNGVALGTSAGLPAWHLHGLALANNGSDANNDIDVAAGACRSDDDTTDIVRSGAITKRLDATWTAGNNNGGRDGGSKTSNTTYHVFAICKNGGADPDVLFSTSLSSPTMPSLYTKKRRIGSILTDGSGNIRGFVQTGDFFQWKSRITASWDDTSSRTPVAIGVPTGLKFAVLFTARMREDSGGGGGTSYRHVVFTSLDENDVAPSSSPSLAILPALGIDEFGSPISAKMQVAGQFEIMTDTAGQIGYRTAGSNAFFIDVATIGWRDTRGRLG